VVELVQDRFPSDETPAIIVLHCPVGMTDQDLAAAQAPNDWLLNESPEYEDRNGVVSVFATTGAESSLRSPDGQTMTLIASITGEAAEELYLDTIFGGEGVPGQRGPRRHPWRKAPGLYELGNPAEAGSRPLGAPPLETSPKSRSLRKRL